MARGASRPRRLRRRATPPARRVAGEVVDIAAAGDGVLQFDGARAFAPLTAPGDAGAFDVVGTRARLVELHTESPLRAKPPCPAYGDCGGCSLQHLADGPYREWKRRRLTVAVAAAGFDPARVGPLATFPAASRRRATFAVSPDGRLGFNERRGPRIVDVSPCLVLAPEIASALAGLQARFRRVDGPFDLAVTACENGLDVDARVGAARRDAAERALLGDPDLVREPIVRVSVDGAPLIARETPVVRVDGVSVAPPPGGFLQAVAAAEALIAAMILDALKDARRVADLFCGVGAFALPLSTSANVYAADADDGAIDALRRAAAGAQSAGRRPIAVERRDLFERPLSAAELREFDAVVIDPPRAGARAQAAAIAEARPPSVVMASCNPATFARDARTLGEAGYDLETARPIDQFRWSAHLEVCAVFRMR
ncbi:MAG: class I SAM-dependent RNA methyltransferase [Parvularculaceae bacterium]